MEIEDGEMLVLGQSIDSVCAFRETGISSKFTKHASGVLFLFMIPLPIAASFNLADSMKFLVSLEADG